MADSRPLYVPSKQRRKQQQRFHGAFTGGFSAGFFNTVGSKEGWKPKQAEEDVAEEENAFDVQETVDAPTAKPKKRPIQKLEDFMDEQDHDEWGGPTTIKQEFSGTQQQEQGDTIEAWMKISIEPPPNVGHRLLRILGWREGQSTAYVPDQERGAQQILGPQQQKEEPNAKVLLSSKKLRKVQLQQKRVKIPPPKLDTCGLGYEPYQNAPEFKAFQEKRRRLAHQRAQLGGGQSSNVYRVSNVLGGANSDDEQDDNENSKKRKTAIQNNNKTPDDDDVYVSYETVEDFVGHKSVGGFALRDDVDDAFDDDPSTLTKATDKVRLDTEEYNDVVYEHHSSDEEEDHYLHHNIQRQSARSSKKTSAAARTTNTATSNGLAGVLSSFADTGGNFSSEVSANAKASGGGVTTDGRKPLEGFVLGGSSSDRLPKRYPGPDVPLSYEVNKHEFTEDEHPLVLKAMSHAVQLEAADEKRRKALDDALKANATSNRPSNRLQITASKGSDISSAVDPSQRPSAPMAGTAFAGLQEAMKNRFTSVTESGNADEDAVKGGLRLPSKEPKKFGDTASKSPEQPQNREIKIVRTSFRFNPHRLLCKRFHVPVPVGNGTSQEEEGRVTEEAYFHKEILNTAASSAVPTQQDRKVNGKGNANSFASMFDEDGTLKPLEERQQQLVEDERPPRSFYKSIFEPQEATAEEDDHSEPEDDESKGKQKSTEETKVHSLLVDSKTTPSVNTLLRVESDIAEVKEDKSKEMSLVPYKERDRKKKRKKHSKKRRKRSRSRDRKSRTSGDDDDNESDSDAEERYKHKKSHRRMSTRSPSQSDDDSSTDLSRDSYSSHERRKRKQRRKRDRKGKKRRKEKKKKKDTTKERVEE